MIISQREPKIVYCDHAKISGFDYQKKPVMRGKKYAMIPFKNADREGYQCPKCSKIRTKGDSKNE